MPCAASFSALTASWVNRELPPSITRSPSASRPDSSSITGATTSTGTMIQTVRGAGSAWTISARVAASETSWLRS